MIAWTITDAGAGPLIVGNCYAPDPIQRRHDFETWAEILQATAWPNGIQRDGVLRLHAHSNGFDGAVSVSVSAEFAADEMS
ncbi:hypothetical protein N5079_16475 [Planotetraspora sp. A-T 1434]|uniref:hypothetical protein n=1 Tax=Planotetraspora sp. A-T 1434 TaxID=2979219 RepID=UPI0021BEDC8B|nr:hypothetical protein [Planotetraspora sp. A-T 1434]MCT9931809.1 hypothetical protein [Planotetraspora sp. A-T 1434]